MQRSLSSSTVLSTSETRRRILAAGAVAAIVLVAGVLLAITFSPGGKGNSSADSDLRATAQSLLPRLDHARGKLPVSDESLRSFQAWVYNTEPTYRALTKHHSKSFAALEFVDPGPFPPQSVQLTNPHDPQVAPAGAVLDQVHRSGKSMFVTVKAGSARYRMYIVPLRTPFVLRPSGSYAVLEVSQELA